MTNKFRFDDITTDEIFIAPSLKRMEICNNINDRTKVVTFRLSKLVGYTVDWNYAELIIIIDGLHPINITFNTEEPAWGSGAALLDVTDHLDTIMDGKSKTYG